jgi:hypothetical protein
MQDQALLSDSPSISLVIKGDVVEGGKSRKRVLADPFLGSSCLE